MPDTIRRGGSRSILISDGIRAAAARTPGKTAIIQDDRQLSYRQLIERIDRVANLAIGLGLRPGERVAIQCRNRIEYLELVCGLSLAGVACATVGPAAAGPELRFICEDASARVLFVDRDLAEAARAHVPGSVERVVVMESDYELLLGQASSQACSVQVDEHHIFSVPYTSGATGRAKGVLLAHRGRVLACYAMAAEHGCYGPDDRAIATTPMFHGAGLLMALVPVFFGGTVTLMSRFDIERLLQTIVSFRATSVYMVPTHFAALFAMGDRARGFDVSALKAVISGTAPLAQSMKARIVDFFGEDRLYERYGTTETNVACALRPRDQLRKIACVGQPLPGTHVRVLDDAGQDCATGEVGELAVASPYLFSGYLNLPEATERAMRGDWFVTGDLARIDDEGYVYIVDRKNDMIISGGENVYPREVEEVLRTHPGIAECAVAGLPHAYWGEAVTAWYVPRAGQVVDVKTLDELCRSRLSAYKVPKSFHPVESLPRNSMGKIVRRELRAAGRTA